MPRMWFFVSEVYIKESIERWRQNGNSKVREEEDEDEQVTASVSVDRCSFAYF